MVLSTSWMGVVVKLFEFQYNRYPSKALTLVLVGAIYINFFSHHYIYDFRWLLLALTFVLFWRVDVYFKIIRTHRHMPLLLGWLLVALFIWIAENIGTLTGVWLYPNQQSGWALVSFDKLLAWYLLMLLSFVMVSLIHPPKLRRAY